ncbi:MAG: M20 metallopeptidase family protein [Thermoplasmata archaeon]
MGARAGPWTKEARRLLPAMRAWRADFHREPELAFEETRTRARIVRALDALGIPSRTYPDFTGVRAVLAPEAPGAAVALRSDMDGLPVTEATGLAYRSRAHGKMHACGHDVHMSALLGAAAILKRRESRLRGPVTLLFQPAEEDGKVGGAGPFLDRGCLDHPTCDFVVGQHVAPEIPLGTIGWRKGPMMAAADHFTIRVRGAAGHAAYPHRGPDSVLAAAEIVTGLQSLVSRMRDPLDPVVVSVGTIHGGTRHNVLPEEVVLEGTVRTLRAETRRQVERQLVQRVRGLAGSGGASVHIRYEHGYPVTVNSPAATEMIVQALIGEFGDAALLELEGPVMGAEDFSRYLERVPGTFWFLGVGTPGPTASLHSPTFAPTDPALVIGAAALTAAVEGLQRT